MLTRSVRPKGTTNDRSWPIPDLQYFFKRKLVNPFMNSEKKRDLLIITLIYLFCAAAIIFLKINFLFSVILLFGLPSSYISFKSRGIIRKTLVYSAVFVIPLTAIGYYMGVLSKTWNTSLMIPWMFIYLYFIISFYEYFYDEDKKKDKMSKNMKYLIWINLTLIILFTIIYFLNKDLLNIKYFYAILILVVFVFPIVFINWNFPSLIKKVTIQGAYFFLLSLIYELIALHLGYWTFGEGNYIGWVTLFGYGMPFEEILWLILAVPAGISIYEFFEDDER